jgi:hypothetical protein
MSKVRKLLKALYEKYGEPYDIFDAAHKFLTTGRAEYEGNGAKRDVLDYFFKVNIFDSGRNTYPSIDPIDRLCDKEITIDDMLDLLGIN